MTGVTILESNVEEINPPINTRANGDINGSLLRAIGVTPPIAVKLRVVPGLPFILSEESLGR